MSKAYGYARVSHADGWKKGESVDAQHARISAYYESKLADTVSWGGVRDDAKNISAYKHAFTVRPAGREIMSLLEPGDHLIVDKVDRLWRSIQDFCDLMSTLKEKDVTLHIVSFLGETITSQSALGDFTLKLLVLMAELESSIKSERTREAKAIAKKKGLPLGGQVQIGCRLHSIYDDAGELCRRELRWCPKQTHMMDRIYHWKITKSMEWDHAAEYIELDIAKMEGREPRERRKYRKDLRKWQRMLRDRCAYDYLKIRDPNDIPSEKCRIEAYKAFKELHVKKTGWGVYSPDYILEKWG